MKEITTIKDYILNCNLVKQLYVIRKMSKVHSEVGRFLINVIFM